MDQIGIIWIVLLVGMMWFMVFRPQRKQQKEKKAMMDAMKKGDRVITVGGIYGIVRNIKDNRVTLEIASEIFVQFAKSAIANVIRPDEAKADAAAKPEAEDEGDEDVDGADDADAGYAIEQDED